MSTLLESRKVLAVVNPSLSFAEYLCLTVVIEMLKKQGATVDMVNASKLPTNFTQAVSLGEVKNVTNVPPRKYIVSFDRHDASVKNIQWQQTDKKVSFHISMEKGDFKPEGLQVDVEGADYDTVLYFKVDNFAGVQSIFAEAGNFLYEVKHIAIGGKFSIDQARVEIVEQADTANLAETIYQELKNQGMNADQNTRLLAAIMGITNHYTTKLSGAKTFSRSAELVNSGANLESANALLEKGKSTAPQNVGSETGKPENKESGNQPTKDTQQKPNQSAQNGQTGSKPAGQI